MFSVENVYLLSLSTFFIGVRQILHSCFFYLATSLICYGGEILFWQAIKSLYAPQGDSLRTNIQLDFGDGTAVSYSNLSWTEEGIRHMYRSTGIFRVTALAENSLGFDSTSLYLHVTCRYHTPSLTSNLI